MGPSSPWLPFHRGDRIALSQMTVKVLELTADGRPAVCEFLFAHPLESSSYLWRTWRHGHLEPFRVPSLGQRETLPSG